MLRQQIFGVLLGTLVATPAFADPTGTYRVSLTEPDTDTRAEGTVIVSRVDQTYRVTWRIGGTTTSGVALGGAFNRGDLVVGPAHREDILLAIGFRGGAEYGSATLIKQFDGSYQGYRVSNTSTKALQERWVPAD